MDDAFFQKLHSEARDPKRDSTIAWWAHRLSMAFKVQVDEYMKEFELPTLEVFLLTHLSEVGPSTLVELSKMLEYTHPAVLRHLDNLEELGYLQRSPHESDRRIKVISLTDKGRELVPKLKEVFRQVHIKSLEGIPVEDQVATLKTLLVMYKNLGGDPEQLDSFHAEVMKHCE